MEPTKLENEIVKSTWSVSSDGPLDWTSVCSHLPLDGHSSSSSRQDDAKGSISHSRHLLMIRHINGYIRPSLEDEWLVADTSVDNYLPTSLLEGYFFPA
ncbi:protein prenyltransferase alpha subunit repeat-containing protein 1-like protein [Anopheles sinensis]|uniref:Protein prenyltransferase alpha subunit repeat-containing protein 1-like protein n=1 Tax=Anopheles sinensis TaxID=74873 RepID=A0A084W460_ANOSI|nr:protein prenyltransferase alpha subunit repeat-containing protein 1-like protein [Anopheles sinensis]